SKPELNLIAELECRQSAMESIIHQRKIDLSVRNPCKLCNPLLIRAHGSKIPHSSGIDQRWKLNGQAHRRVHDRHPIARHANINCSPRSHRNITKVNITRLFDHDIRPLHRILFTRKYLNGRIHPAATHLEDEGWPPRNDRHALHCKPAVLTAMHREHRAEVYRLLVRMRPRPQILNAHAPQWLTTLLVDNASADRPRSHQSNLARSPKPSCQLQWHWRIALRSHHAP